MDIETLRQFFLCWMIVNVILYFISVVAIMLARQWIISTNVKFFKVSEETSRNMIYRFVAQYKLFLIVFNFSPWLALVLMK